ncbi:hypothetical protein [Rhizobium azibense]|uniref:Uncharacterized protein n=1 Tax=Rhizobium azibense TaxID=1136135 RepID=A0A4R3RUN7_9HYPH|nr:hypothetical protein [Rhizobium azibense]TCU35446.1 hypothetical protein EV129_10936 [Rhizobium azibense]
MTAMSQARPIVEIEGKFTSAPMKGATTILQGALVVTENSLAVPGKSAVGLTVLGIAEETVVNSGTDGAKRVNARRGTFKFFNLAADAIVAGDVGKDCYLVDDQTVAKTNGTNTRSMAGKIINVESDGVFVKVG